MTPLQGAGKRIRKGGDGTNPLGLMAWKKDPGQPQRASEWRELSDNQYSNFQSYEHDGI